MQHPSQAPAVAISIDTPAVSHTAVEQVYRPLPRLISATNDDQLIAAWLSRPHQSATTVRNARKEAERFLLWCRWCGLELATVTLETLSAYAVFLRDPQPQEMWVSTTRWPRHDARWRPFTQPLSLASQRQALVILHGLLQWATDAHYLPANPATLLGKMPSSARQTVERYLPMAALSYLRQAVANLPSQTSTAHARKARAHFLLDLFYLTGARLHEVVRDVAHFKIPNLAKL
jgi:integrase/recombinase XerD